MSRYFAQLNNNIVQRVIVADDINWCIDRLGGEWVETFMSNPTKNYAGVGHRYHTDKDNFAPEQPFPSWTLSADCKWKAPKEKGIEEIGYKYEWDEQNQDWIKLKIK